MGTQTRIIPAPQPVNPFAGDPTQNGVPTGGTSGFMSPFGPGGVPYSLVGGGVVPNAGNLEIQSSLDIGQLLNPGTSFPDVNRQSAEIAAGRGIPGSAAAYGTGLRMTDEERLRRIALGENLLSGAYARNQPNIITPYQQSQLDIQRGYLDIARQRGDLSQAEYEDQLRRLGQPNVTYGGGLPGSGGPTPSISGPLGGAYAPPVAYSGTGPSDTYPNTPGTYPNPSAPLLPLYPGGDVGGGEFDWNDALDQLGLGDVGTGPVNEYGDFGLGDFSGGNDYGGYA